jgi:hypothetical protein
MYVEESRLASYAKHAANISQTRDLFGNHRVMIKYSALDFCEFEELFCTLSQDS